MKTIIISAKKADSFFSKFVGLMFQKPYPIFLKTRFGIHTFFMTGPIDAVILDNDFRVVTMKEHVKPFQIFLWNPKYSHVLELPEGTIKTNRMNIGNKIIIQGV